MASASTHFVVGAALALPALRSRAVTALLPQWIIPLSAGFLAMTPDLDLAGRRLFGIPPSSLFAHRGFFHSPFFLITLAATLAFAIARASPARKFACLWLLWAGCMVTHPLLDALTDGGRGVMLLVPLARTRLHFRWHPIYSPPGGRGTLLARAFLIRSSEVPFCAAAIVAGLAGMLRLKRSSATALQPK